jgi:hypothetical protein
MLAAAAVRLTAIEALSPTGAATWPTLAGARVYDSRVVPVSALGARPTPVISIYAGAAQSSRRGDASASWDRATTVTLEIIAELAVVMRAEGGATFADAAAENDADAALMLDGLVAQIRRTLELAPEGQIFRKAIKGSIARIEVRPDILPETGLRFARRMISLEVEVRDDAYSEASGLAEPLASAIAALPEGSYAKARLADLATRFSAFTLPDLEEIAVTAEPNTTPDEPSAGVIFGD